MRRSASSRADSSSSSVGCNSSNSSTKSSGNNNAVRRIRRRPTPLRTSPSCNIGNVLALGLDVDTMRMVLCDCVPHYSSGDEELLSMLDGLFQELDAAQLRQFGSSSSSSMIAVSNRRVEQILSNVVTVLTCFLDGCHSSVPPIVIFHVHSLVGQVRDLVLQTPESALKAYTKALWLASWSEDIPDACVARTLHRIGSLKGSNQQYDEARKLLRQAIATYAASGISSDHAAVVDCQRTLREVEVKYWSTIGANEDSWSSLAGLCDRRIPLPRIREEQPGDPIVEYSSAAAITGCTQSRDAPSA